MDEKKDEMSIEEFIIDETQIVINNHFIEKHIPGLSSLETNLLMGFMGRLKEKGSNVVTISFNEVGLMSNSETPTWTNNLRLLESLWAKVKAADYEVYAKNEHQEISGSVLLFSTMLIDTKNREVTFGINPYLEYFVNQFNRGNFTSIKYKNLLSIEDSYAKKLHILLSQYSSTGFYSVKNEDLKEFLDCPKSYSNSKFVSFVLEKAIDALQDEFPGLNMEIIRQGRGGKIFKYEFRFKKKFNQNKWVEDKYKKKSESSVKEVNPTYVKEENGDMSMEEYAHEVEKLFVK